MPRPYTFTPEQEARLAGGESHQQIATAFGISTMPVRRWRTKHGWGWSTTTPTSTAPAAAAPALGAAAVDGPREEDLLRAEVSQLRSQLRRTDKASVGDERVLRAIEAAVQVEPVRLPVSPRKPHSADGEKPHHRQILLLSDFHYGETVNKAQMNGLNEYNTTIAEERLRSIVQSVLGFKRNRAAMTGLEVWCLGDMSSGAIHKLEESNEIPAAEQFVRAGYLLADAVETLAQHYDEVKCAGIVGNHPRPAPEPASTDAHNNGDWISYHLASAASRRTQNVVWEVPVSAQLVRQVAGLKFLLWHGDGVRSSMPGVPWGGVMRRWNELKGTYAAQGIHLDASVLGHFHQACAVPGVYMNGSIVGPNPHGRKNYGGGQRPTQLLLTVDEKRSRVTDVCYLTP